MGTKSEANYTVPSSLKTNGRVSLLFHECTSQLPWPGNSPPFNRNQPVEDCSLAAEINILNQRTSQSLTLFFSLV